MRTRVAINDWCASRNVVSVISSRFCLRVQAANFFGPSLQRSWRVPACGSESGTDGSTARFEIRRNRLAFHFRIAVQDHVAEIAEQPRRAIARAAANETVRVLVEKRRGDFARAKFRMIDDVFDEAEYSS